VKATLFALTTLFALSVAACSSSDSGGTTTKKDSGTDGASTGETGGDKDTGGSTEDTGGTTTEDTGGTTTGDEACLMQADGNACFQCCGMNHTDGATTYQNTVLECACRDTTCKSACASTFCAATPKAADSACNTCLDGMAAQTACSDALGTACTGDCQDFYDCASKCPM
jgi:hypothetical protein